MRSHQPPLYVDALPDDPYDGQEIYFDTGTPGVLWRFRHNAGSASPYKWEFAGGAALAITSGSPNRTITATSYAAVPTDSLSLALPALAGDFQIAISGVLVGPGGIGALYLSYATNGAGSNSSDSWAAVQGLSIASTSGDTERNHFGLGSSTVIRERARVTTGSGVVANRRLKVLPIRVG